jgi:predicted nucleotidyltransferase
MFEIKDRLSLLVVHGSHAYGLNTPESDKDFRGILIEPIDYNLSVVNNFEQSENHKITTEDEDTTIFGLKKFIKLALDSNPNVLELLFVGEEEILFKDRHSHYLINNRDLFLSKKIYLTFGGYAKAQLKRLENHRNWIVDPPSPPPTRTEFGLLEIRPISEDTYKAAKSLINKKINEYMLKDVEEFERNDKIELIESIFPNVAEIMDYTNDKLYQIAAKSLGFDDNIIEYLQKEKQYTALVEKYANYLNWQETRNKKRYETELKCLCDTKHASHLIRLLFQAIDALNGKSLILKRNDEERKILLDIKNGVHGVNTYDYVMDLKNVLDKQLEESNNNSKLPRKPDREKIDSLYREILLEKWEEDRNA